MLTIMLIGGPKDGEYITLNSLPPALEFRRPKTRNNIFLEENPDIAPFTRLIYNKVSNKRYKFRGYECWDG